MKTQSATATITIITLLTFLLGQAQGAASRVIGSGTLRASLNEQLDGRVMEISSEEELGTITYSTSFVLVYFYITQGHYKKLKPIADHVSRTSLKIQVVLFDAHRLRDFSVTGLKRPEFPAVNLYIHGDRKHYSGDISTSAISDWLKQVLDAGVEYRHSITQIEGIDSHYFVWVNYDFLRANQRDFDILAKLIHPLRVYTGFELENAKKPGTSFSDAVAFRKYRKEVSPIDMNTPLEVLASRLIESEFLKEMECDNDSFDLFMDFRIPSLLYYYNSTEQESGALSGSAELTAIRSVFNRKAEYLTLIKIDISLVNRCTSFMMDFMNVTTAPAVRILNLVANVRRFKFSGNFDVESIESFVDDYLSGNLRHYALDQTLSGNESIFGIPLANYSILKQAKRNGSERLVILAFDPNDPKLQTDIEQFKIVQNRLELTHKYKFYALDHTKNDIDGFLQTHLPLVLCVLRNGQMTYMRTDTVTAKNIWEFLENNVPEFKHEAGAPGDL